jgi:hypothetical protein
MMLTNLWKKFTPSVASKPVDSGSPLQPFRLSEQRVSDLKVLLSQLQSQGVLRQWFDAEYERQRKMAEELILTPINNLSDVITREQVIGTLSQMRLQNELFDRLAQQIKVEVEKKEKQQTERPT